MLFNLLNSTLDQLSARCVLRLDSSTPEICTAVFLAEAQTVIILFFWVYGLRLSGHQVLLVSFHGNQTNESHNKLSQFGSSCWAANLGFPALSPHAWRLENENGGGSKNRWLDGGTMPSSVLT